MAFYKTLSLIALLFALFSCVTCEFSVTRQCYSDKSCIMPSGSPTMLDACQHEVEGNLVEVYSLSPDGSEITVCLYHGSLLNCDTASLDAESMPQPITCSTVPNRKCISWVANSNLQSCMYTYSGHHNEVDTGMIIGVAVGGAALVAAVALISLFLYRHGRNAFKLQMDEKYFADDKSTF